MECAVRGGRGSGGGPRAELAAGGPGSPGRRGGAAARTGRASARGEAGCARGCVGVRPVRCTRQRRGGGRGCGCERGGEGAEAAGDRREVPRGGRSGSSAAGVVTAGPRGSPTLRGAPCTFSSLSSRNSPSGGVSFEVRVETQVTSPSLHPPVVCPGWGEPAAAVLPASGSECRVARGTRFLGRARGRGGWESAL